MNKKGQAIDGLGSLIVPLIGIGILLVIGLLIISQVRDQIVDTQSGDWCSSPYGLNVDTSGAANCCNATRCKDDSIEIYNITLGACCNSTSTLPYDCAVGNVTPAITSLNCTAGQTVGAAVTFAFNGTNKTIGAISDIPGWLPIIVITIIGALLIGLVAFFRRNS